MLRLRLAATIGFPLVVLNAACADPGPSLADCSAVAVTVSAGTQPTFNWTPACQVEALTVALHNNHDVIVWGAVSPNQTNTIGSPVPYGSTPPGAAATANRIEPLVSGTTYEVTVFRMDDGGTIRAVGTATFLYR